MPQPHYTNRKNPGQIARARYCRVLKCKSRLPAGRYFYCRVCMAEVTEDTFRSHGIEKKITKESVCLKER